MNIHRAILIAGLFLISLNAFPEDPDREEALKRLDQAMAKTNIFELPSFFLKANVQIRHDGKLLDGTYQFLWNGPDQWRDEIAFSGYTELRVGGKGNVWIKRSSGALPLRIQQLHSALGFDAGAESGWLVRNALRPDDVIRKQYSHKEQDQNLTCFHVEPKRAPSYDVCINENLGAIQRREPNQDGDLRPAAGKFYPRQITNTLEHEITAKVAITELTSPAAFPAGVFTPPAAVRAVAGCMNPVAPRVIEKVIPKYPESARHAHIEGTVGVDVWIMEDGQLKVAGVVANATKDLDQSAKDAVAHWRYEPAACGGQAVPMEMVVTVNYTLR